MLCNNRVCLCRGLDFEAKLAMLLVFLYRYCFAFVVQDWNRADKGKPGLYTFRPFAESTPALLSYLVDQAIAQRDIQYVVVMDSGFTTVKGVRLLLSKGVHVVGAVKPQFSGIPANVLLRKSKKNVVGACVASRTLEGDILLQSWVDRGPVNILSTFHTGVSGKPGSFRGGPTMLVPRWRKKDDLDWKKMSVPCPEAVVCYQKFMKGVDKHDQVGNNCLITFSSFHCCVASSFVQISAHAKSASAGT